MSAFTEADRTLVARVLMDGSSFTDAAERVLTALADAGRLTPADAVQPRVKVVKAWYRSLKADGSVWCESSDASEVAERSEGTAAKFERLVITQVIGTWEPWVAADGTP